MSSVWRIWSTPSSLLATISNMHPTSSGHSRYIFLKNFYFGWRLSFYVTVLNVSCTICPSKISVRSISFALSDVNRSGEWKATLHFFLQWFYEMKLTLRLICSWTRLPEAGARRRTITLRAVISVIARRRSTNSSAEWFKLRYNGVPWSWRCWKYKSSWLERQISVFLFMSFLSVSVV